MFRRRPQSLQSTLMLTFSGLSVVIILITGALLYVKFVDNARTRELAATQEALHQTKDTLEDYLTRMRQIADTAYYNVVKENDVQRQSAQIHTGLNTLYEGNRDELITLALYNDTGKLVLAEPVVTQKTTRKSPSNRGLNVRLPSLQMCILVGRMSKTCLIWATNASSG